MKGSMQPPKGPLLGIEVEDDSDDDGLDAAKDILEAIADKDAEALNMALKRHYETCESKDSSDDDEE